MQHQTHQTPQQTLSDAGSNVDYSSMDISKLDVNQLLKDSFQPQKPNVTYTCKWKQHLKWVNEANGIGPAEDGKCITQDNVDKFFLLNQRSKINALSKNLSQMKDAMQFHTDFYEYPPPSPKFQVESRIVTK